MVTDHQLETERGSALLITMIVITVIGSIAFSIGASTVSSLRQQAQLEDSQNAYQAAVAGLEDGLLRWRFDKDVETPTGCDDADRPTTSTEYFTRFNLSKGEVTDCVLPNDVVSPDPTEIVYDIKIHYKKDGGEEEKVISQPTDEGLIPALAKDQVVEYDVEDLPSAGANSVDLGWIFNNFDEFDDSQRLEVFALDREGNVIENSRYLSTPDDNTDIQFGSTIPYSLNYPTGTGTRIRIRPFGEDLEEYKLVSSNPNVQLDSRTTTVEVVGYFGLSKRKLKLSLDRASGSLLPIYDHVLFSESTGISPSPSP